MKEQRNFENPFSAAFLEIWELWKDYKQEVHDFRYKGVISEQVAMKHLVDLSGGEEEKATKIIEQSIRRQWQGFFPLHETTNGTRNGKSNSKASAEQPTLREQSAKVFNIRNAAGG